MKRRLIVFLAGLCLTLSVPARAEEPELARLERFRRWDGVLWASVTELASALGSREQGEITAIPGEEWIRSGEREYYVPGGVREERGECLVPAEEYCRAAGYRAFVGETGAMLLWRTEKPRWSENDLCWLSRLVWAEARSEGLESQIAVAEVVLNRVKCPWYPDTVEGVIFDTENGVQFSPVLDGSIYNDANESCLHAARIALSGSETVPDETLFFVTADLWDSWVGRNREYLFAMGDILFFA